MNEREPKEREITGAAADLPADDQQSHRDYGDETADKIGAELGTTGAAIVEQHEQPPPQTEVHPMELAAERDAPYACFTAPEARWFCVFASHNLGYRIGPLQGDQVGPIIEKCNAMGIALLVTLETYEVDWDYVIDLMGGRETLEKRKAASNPALWFSVDWDKAAPLKLADVVAGEYLLTDGGFTCMRLGLHRVDKDGDGGLYLVCDDDAHYLSGQLGADGMLVGIRRPLKTRPAESAP